VPGPAPCGALLRAFAAGIIAVVVAGGSPQAEPVDHYVFALSWSPTWCEGRPPSDAPLQCGEDADHGFVVHGLWPNTARGAPGFCDTHAPPPARAVVRGMLDIMPSEGLVHHQWRKHGTCSGLDAPEYFAAVRRAAERVSIPPGLSRLAETTRVRPAVLREAFIRANPGLAGNGIYVRCRREDLVDVRICMTPALDFRACTDIERRRCRTKVLTIDPPR